MNIFNNPKVKKASDYAKSTARGKKRHNGDSVFSHLLAVAQKTAEMGLGPDAVCSAFLHDVIEDNPDHPEYKQKIKKIFGPQVLKLILDLSDLRNTPAETSETKEILAAQQYLLSSVTDLRVIMIKLADKLHNLSTIDGLSTKRQTTYMKEIERIFKPIAEYLGLGSLHREMDDLLFSKQHPEEFKRIKKFCDDKSKKYKRDIQRITNEIETMIEIEEIPHAVYGRKKGIASIWRKTAKYKAEGKGKKLDHINDIFAFRAITDTEEHCYTILSIIQTFYTTRKNYFKDYIATHKPNGYKALHLQPVDKILGKFELQICTDQMYHNNEFGPASHIAYKIEGKRNTKASDKYKWIEQVNISHSKKDLVSLDQPITTNLFNESIFVLTPNMDFIRLPVNASPLDLAYKIHTTLGNQCVGCLVNKRLVSLDHKLKTGDIVEILTNPQKKYASHTWLNYVVSTTAKEKIRKSLKH